jgi:hypothetical protein
MPFFNEHSFETFFATTMELQVDKMDLRNLEAFLSRNLSDLLVRGYANAKDNRHEAIERQDLPITKGLNDTIYRFREFDTDKKLRGAMEDAVDTTIREANLEMPLGEAAREFLPQVVGGLSLSLAQTFKIIDPDLRNPGPAEWDKVFRIFEQLV